MHTSEQNISYAKIILVLLSQDLPSPSAGIFLPTRSSVYSVSRVGRARCHEMSGFISYSGGAPEFCLPPSASCMISVHASIRNINSA